MEFDPPKRQGIRMKELSGLLEILGYELFAHYRSIEERNGR